MTRFLCDTSGLVAALCSWHEHHARTVAELEWRASADEQLVLAAHSLVETYSVLTRLPPPGRLRASDAIALIEANWRDTPVVHLTGRETWGVLRDAERRRAKGGATYDMLIAASALKAGATTIVTWNLRHFALIDGEIEVQAPA